LRRLTSEEIRRSSETRHGSSEEFQPDAVCSAVLTRLEPGGCNIGGASLGQAATARNGATRKRALVLESKKVEERTSFGLFNQELI
jgi:hypothetical protein